MEKEDSPPNKGEKDNAYFPQCNIYFVFICPDFSNLRFYYVFFFFLFRILTNIIKNGEIKRLIQIFMRAKINYSNYNKYKDEDLNL